MPSVITLSGSGRAACSWARKAGKNGVRACVCTDSRGRTRFAKHVNCGGTPKRKHRR